MYTGLLLMKMVTLWSKLLVENISSFLCEFQINEKKMADLKPLINEWLSEYASLQENEIKSFAAEHEHNHEISTSIFNLFYLEDDTYDGSHSNDGKDEQYEQVASYYYMLNVYLNI